jgi:glutathione S-transferase
MKLYYTPGVCSLSPHIVLREAEYQFDLEKVDLKTKKTEFDQDFNTITEKSAVPFLVLDNGETLTEGVAIVQYLADLKPETNLAPKNGTMERVRLQEWLNYISTEIHKTHWPLFYADQAGEQAGQVYLKKLYKAYDYVSSSLQDKQYLMGDRFTVADAYMFTVINWHNFIKVDLSPWPVLVEYQKRVAARPKVQEAMKAEGLTRA